jgi:hypothetical protein
MSRKSKIARLPIDIREELNHRLDAEHQANDLVQWLNGLPQVSALVASEFDGHPITPQNLSDWKSGGFRDWCIYQKVRSIVATSSPDDPELKQLLTGALADKLTHWLTLRFAAAAQSLNSLDDPDPKAELRLLGELSADVLALRRSQLSAGRLELEQQRLAIELSKAQAIKEQEFWEWTKRPDIQEKLYPNHDSEKKRRAVERMINRRLLGIRDSSDSPDEHADPAVLI